MSYGLSSKHCDPVLVSQKVCAGVYKGITTSQLDELAAETAAAMTANHPDYASKMQEHLRKLKEVNRNLRREIRATFSMTCQGSHGFMTTHRWSDTIGAFIDVEASGTGGFDLVCQSGPGSWPSYIYSQSAVYPMANSTAQDVFGAIPVMFANDYGDIPGLDIIFLLGGYFYHTSSNTADRILPGSMQARGDNLFSLMKAFANSTKLLTAQERESFGAAASRSKGERPVFFDYLAQFLVFYSRRQALVLHIIPFAIFLLMPLLLCLRTGSLFSTFNSYYDFIKGLLYHASGIILAIVFPVNFSILLLLFTGKSMNWFSNPYSAFLMFVPCSVVGLLVPRILCRQFPLSRCFSSRIIKGE